MKGGTLMRYRPDEPPQGGGQVKQVLKDLTKLALSGAVQGFKKGRGVKGRIRSAKVGAKRAVKRKAEETVNRFVKRKLSDIFGE